MMGTCKSAFRQDVGRKDSCSCLSVRLHGIHVGVLCSTPDGGLSFSYDSGWLVDHAGNAETAGLSFAMPALEGRYGHGSAGPFFAGLLPDGTILRSRLGEHLRIDGLHDLALLRAIGSDCQGAVSIHEMSEAVMHDSEVLPLSRILSEQELARHLRDLRRRPLFVDAEAGFRLSLAGVNPKAGVVCVGNRLALPRRRMPTTHIVKADITGLTESIWVEHFCLEVARRIGFNAVRSAVLMAEGIPFLLVARFDRTMGSAGGKPFVRRIHQQDFCQALGRMPSYKYERDGGPGWSESFRLMERTVDPASSRLELLRRAIFQFLIGNPDAHAKNYALVHRVDGIHLSKLYDLNNAAAFRNSFKHQRQRLAMSVGGEFDLSLLEERHWIAFARDVGIDEDMVLRELQNMSVTVAIAATDIRENLKQTSADSPLLDLATEDVIARCRRVLVHETD